MGMSALFLGIVLAIANSAFTPQLQGSRAEAYWRFDGTSLSQSKTSGSYTMIDVSEIPSCSNAEEIPCVLQVDANVDTPSELQTVLNGYASNQAVVDNAFATKEE